MTSVAPGGTEKHSAEEDFDSLPLTTVLVLLTWMMAQKYFPGNGGTVPSEAQDFFTAIFVSSWKPVTSTANEPDSWKTEVETVIAASVRLVSFFEDNLSISADKEMCDKIETGYQEMVSSSNTLAPPKVEHAFYSRYQTDWVDDVKLICPDGGFLANGNNVLVYDHAGLTRKSSHVTQHLIHRKRRKANSVPYLQLALIKLYEVLRPVADEIEKTACSSLDLLRQHMPRLIQMIWELQLVLHNTGSIFKDATSVCGCITERTVEGLGLDRPVSAMVRQLSRTHQASPKLSRYGLTVKSACLRYTSYIRSPRHTDCVQI